jgi:hypothetical protein
MMAICHGRSAEAISPGFNQERWASPIPAAAGGIGSLLSLNPSALA